MRCRSLRGKRLAIAKLPMRRRVFHPPFAWEIELDHAAEVIGRRHLLDIRAEVPRPWPPLGIAGAELPHQERPLLRSKPLDHQLEVPQHDLALLVERGIGRNRLTAQGGSRLSK